MKRDVAVLEALALHYVKRVSLCTTMTCVIFQSWNEVRWLEIVSDRDLRCYLSELFRSEPEATPASARKTLTIRQIMQAKPVSVEPDSDLQEVIECIGRL
jgi:hypothetical protein